MSAGPETLRDYLARKGGGPHYSEGSPDAFLALLALAERVARLNRDAGEIGAGMLASLIDDARAAVAKAKALPAQNADGRPLSATLRPYSIRGGNL